jgi:hypothetical protein
MLAASTDVADFASTFATFGHNAIFVTSTKEGVISTNIDLATFLDMGSPLSRSLRRLSARQIAASSPPSRKTKLYRSVLALVSE